MDQFATLLKREWMQHRTGWLALSLVPMGLLLLAVVFGDMKIGNNVSGGSWEEAGTAGPLPIFAMVLAATALSTMAMAWLATLIQASGLARRDQQDRSIEFWLSLPVGHVQSLGATLLVHLLLVPIGALLLGLLGGAVLALLVTLKAFGVSNLVGLPWGDLLVAVAATTARLMVGVALATAWLSPLILGGMAASAWLKRWGIPALVGGLAIGHAVLYKSFGTPIIGQTVREWLAGAALALTGTKGPLHFSNLDRPDHFAQFLQAWPGALWDNLASAIGLLAVPQLVLGLALAAGCFGLLVLRRQRGA